jgi:hypothetical protein
VPEAVLARFEGRKKEHYASTIPKSQVSDAAAGNAPTAPANGFGSVAITGTGPTTVVGPTVAPAPNAGSVVPTMAMPMTTMMPGMMGMPGHAGVAAIQQTMGYPYPPVFAPPYFYEPRTPHTRSSHAHLAQEDSPGPIQVHYPLISEWLQDLLTHKTRGSDNIDYTAFADKFAEAEIRRLDDLALWTAADLVNEVGMKSGMAKRLLNWALFDKEQLDKNARKERGLRLY